MVMSFKQIQDELVRIKKEGVNYYTKHSFLLTSARTNQKITVRPSDFICFYSVPSSISVIFQDKANGSVEITLPITLEAIFDTIYLTNSVQTTISPLVFYTGVNFKINILPVSSAGTFAMFDYSTPLGTIADSYDTDYYYVYPNAKISFVCASNVDGYISLIWSKAGNDTAIDFIDHYGMTIDPDNLNLYEVGREVPRLTDYLKFRFTKKTAGEDQTIFRFSAIRY